MGFYLGTGNRVNEEFEPFHFSWRVASQLLRCSRRNVGQKIESFSHQEFNTPEIASLEKIREARRSGVDPLRRPGQNISVASVCNLRDIPNVVRVMLNI